jgi:transposase
MKSPINVRPLNDAEQKAVEAGLRSSNAFVLRRCQILRASARGERVPVIARALRCDEQTVRNAIHAFNNQGLDALQEGSSRPHHTQSAFSAVQIEQLIVILHRKPRTFDKPTSLWTLDLLAQVSYEQGLSRQLVTGETVRATLERFGIRWKRAKRWITSPDPEYLRKKARATV